MSLKDTAALAPILGLDHVLTSLAPANYTLNKLSTSFPDFFRNVSDILSASSKDTVQAFFSWKVIQATAGSVIAPEVKPLTRFMNQLTGKVCAFLRSGYYSPSKIPSDISVGPGRDPRAVENVHQPCG